MTNTHSRVRTTAASAVVALLATTAAGALAAPASAAPDQSVAGSSTVAMSIPDKGASTPASTSITIPAGKGQVKDVDITLNGLTHSCISDLEVTLVHNGVTAKVMDDAVDCNDPAAPSGSVVVDGGATATDTSAVTLALAASDPADFSTGLASMRFSNDGTNWSAFQPYATSAAWTLSTGDGTKTVFVQYADGIGNLSNPSSDTILLDTTAP